MKNLSLWFEWIYSTFWGVMHFEKYDRAWDSLLSAILDSGHAKISNLGAHTVEINGVEVWIANRFYSYGHIYRSLPAKSGRPSVRTMIKLAAMLKPLQEAQKYEAEKKRVAEMYKLMNKPS